MFYTAIIFKILKGSLNLGFICQRYVFIKKLTKLVVVVNLFKLVSKYSALKLNLFKC